MNWFLVAVFSLSLIQINSSIIPGISGPLHASCKVHWSWPMNDCKTIQSAILNQISVWNTEDNCKNGGEKCLYILKSQSENSISASHMTPVKHYNDSLEFRFSPSQNACEVDASSSSDTWYAVLDFGTNYCNLNNLITGAQLDKLKGYKEVTSDSICTQYSSANCTVY